MHENWLNRFSLILILKKKLTQPCTALPDANRSVISDNKHMWEGPEGYWREGEGTQVSGEVAEEDGGWYLIIITFFLRPFSSK